MFAQFNRIFLGLFLGCLFLSGCASSRNVQTENSGNTKEKAIQQRAQNIADRM